MTLQRMKQAINEKRDLDAIEEWNNGLTKCDYCKAGKKIGLSGKQLQIYCEGKGLELLNKTLTKTLERKDEFATERELSERFGKDTDPNDWPWSSTEKLRDTIDEVLWKRRITAVNMLFKIAQYEVKAEIQREKERVIEEKRIAALSKIPAKVERKTLEWHREQIAKQKALEEKENEKINKKKA